MKVQIATRTGGNIIIDAADIYLLTTESGTHYVCNTHTDLMWEIDEEMYGKIFEWLPFVEI